VCSCVRAHLPLPHQLSLQVVDLEEGPVGAGGGAERPHRPHGPPGRSGGALALGGEPAAAAHGEGPEGTVVRRGPRRRRQVAVGFGPQGHRCVCWAPCGAAEQLRYYS